MDTSQLKIAQVIGCAYTYRVSLAARRRFAAAREDHSSHHKTFSYFKKIERPEDIIENGDALVLRRHPETGKEVDHWYEPELAFLLGKKHTIVAYALANDLTAAALEFAQTRGDFDPTYYGKCWPGSCAIAPRFFSLSEIGNPNELEIGLRILRAGRVIYDHSYLTSQRLRDFSDFPALILERMKEFGNKLPRSKQILVESTGFLPEWTVVLAGTGLITPKACYANNGDVVTVYSPELAKLTNPIRLVH